MTRLNVALLRRAVDARKGDAESGILCASGFVAGEGLAGVFIVGYAFARNLGRYSPPEATTLQALIALAGLAAIGVVLYRSARKPA